MHTPHPTCQDPPLAISYGNHQKSLVDFSHLAPLMLFFFIKRRSQKGERGGMAQCPSPQYATDMIPSPLSFFAEFGRSI